MQTEVTNEPMNDKTVEARNMIIWNKYNIANTVT